MIVFFYSYYHTSEIKTWLIYLINFNSYLSLTIFITTQIVFSSLLLPCSLFPIISGIIWGFKFGVVISTVSAVLSGITTFFIARHFLKNNYIIVKMKAKLERPENKSFLNLAKKSNNEALRSFLVSINPILPAASFGYIFGSSKMQIKNYLLGLVIGSLLLNIVFVFSGAVLN